MPRRTNVCAPGLVKVASIEFQVAGSIPPNPAGKAHAAPTASIEEPLLARIGRYSRLPGESDATAVAIEVRGAVWQEAFLEDATIESRSAAPEEITLNSTEETVPRNELAVSTFLLGVVVAAENGPTLRDIVRSNGSRSDLIQTQPARLRAKPGVEHHVEPAGEWKSGVKAVLGFHFLRTK